MTSGSYLKQEIIWSMLFALPGSNGLVFAGEDGNKTFPSVIFCTQIFIAWLSKPYSGLLRQLILIIIDKQGKSEGFDSCDRPSNLAQIWSKSSIFQPVWPWNLMDDLKN